MKMDDRGHVRIGEYDITADNLQWILSRVSKVQSGDKKGQDRFVVIGYYTSLKNLVIKISDEEIKNQLDGAKDLRDATEDAMYKLIEDMDQVND